MILALLRSILSTPKRERARKQLAEAQQAYHVCKARGDKRGQGQAYLRASHAMRDVLASEVGRGVFNIIRSRA